MTTFSHSHHRGNWTANFYLYSEIIKTLLIFFIIKNLLSKEWLRLKIILFLFKAIIQNKTDYLCTKLPTCILQDNLCNILWKLINSEKKITYINNYFIYHKSLKENLMSSFTCIYDIPSKLQVNMFWWDHSIYWIILVKKELI